MKTLKDHINEIDSNMLLDTKLNESEAIDMRPMKIMAPQNSNGDDALWNSTKDRWSRKAKHQIKLSEKLDTDTAAWIKGDLALYNDQKVEVTIPTGPRDTVGIMVEGKIKMVSSAALTKLDEAVMGGMTQLNPLNRMMQLAGISMSTVMSPATESTEVADDENVLEEADTTNMFEALFKANFSGEYRNNPDAARLATIGQVMVGLESQVAPLRGKVDQTLQDKLNVAVGLGASLIAASKAMLKPETTEE